MFQSRKCELYECRNGDDVFSLESRSIVADFNNHLELRSMGMILFRSLVVLVEKTAVSSR